MRYLFGVLCLLGSLSSSAAEVGGVTFPDRVELGEGETLMLNGAGMRKKFFVSVYAAGLYLPETTSDAQAVIAGDEPRQIVMHFVYDGVSREKITGGWTEGFRANLDGPGFSAVEADLNAFNDLFENAREDDVYVLTYRPGQGTEVRLNGETRGQVGGQAFIRALLSVWLGGQPADPSLKRALLGR